jgi:hypothetical protein
MLTGEPGGAAMNTRVETTETARSMPIWFWVAAGAVLLFELIGLGGLMADLLSDKNKLPLDQRTLAMARPVWMSIAYGVATITGFAGALLLIRRRARAEPLLLISLVAAAVTFLPYLITPAVRDAIGQADMIAAAIVLVLASGSFGLAHAAHRRGWLA